MIIFIVLTVVAIVILIKVANKSQREEDFKRVQREEAAKRQIEENKKKKEREEALLKQKQLVEKYAGSPLTRSIIRAISDSAGHKPEEITIYNDHITGCTNGVVRTYDFRVNRVPFFSPAIKYAGELIDESRLIRPQVAMAEAINRVLGGEYRVNDIAKRSREEEMRRDGDTRTVYGYISDHVVMRLKPTNNF